MKDTVFGLRNRLPGWTCSRTRVVVCAARALRGLGVNGFQHIAAHPTRVIRVTVRRLGGEAVGLVRRLLMYTGGDDFVLADRSVRQFVARAIGQRSVTAARATTLLRLCAHKMLLSPRYLDAQIWNDGRCRR